MNNGLDKNSTLDSFMVSQNIDTPRFTHSDSSSVTVQSLLISKECKLLRIEEIIKHKCNKDIWAIVGGKVFDVSNFCTRHPEVLLCFVRCIGKDATNDIHTVLPDMKPEIFFKDELVGYVAL